MGSEKEKEASSSESIVTFATIKKEEGVQPITGREIIQDYIQLKSSSIEKYQKLHRALASFCTWSDPSRITFLEQFVDLYDILDGKFHELVEQFCRIQWHTVPPCIRHKFVNFLASLATHHIHHISVVFNSFIRHLLPSFEKSHMKKHLDTEQIHQAIDPQTQEELYKLAHESIQSVIASNQLSSRMLLKSCSREFPHIRQPASKLLPYVRNLIQLAENCADEEVSVEIWSLIIDRLLQLDASITDMNDEESRLSFCRSNELCTSNASEPEYLEPEMGTEKENQMQSKFDKLISLILFYIGVRSGKTIEFANLAFNNDSEDQCLQQNLAIFLQRKHDNSHDIGQILFKILVETFDEHVLSATGVHSIPFIWLYICSFSEENCALMFEYLWEVLTSSVHLPNDWKKAHNAAAFLCGFLARANYVNFEISYNWLQRISNWCLDYVNQRATTGKNIAKTGSQQHGTFYATVQALLFIICYRHDELQNSDALDKIRSLKLDKIIYNFLDPLHHISQGVALCFLNLNRRFQVIKSTTSIVHEQPIQAGGATTHARRRRNVVELFFPFSFCSLEICSPLILPLMRRFSSHQSTHATSSNSSNNVETDELNVFGETEVTAVDEGYEEELMCVQTVRDFSKYYLMENDVEDNQEMEF